MTKDEALKMIEIALEWTYYEVDLVEIKEALQPPNPPNPPKRPWASLTQEQKDSLLLPFGSYWVIDAIEAMLKENNGV